MKTESSNAIVKSYSYEDDAKAVLAIEKLVYPRPWTSEELEYCNRPSCGGFVYKRGNRVVGYVFYEVKSGVIEILNLVVAPDYQRRGIASALLSSLKEKARLIGDGFASAAKIKCYVREYGKELQLCLKANQFWATKIIKEHFDDNQETAYRMDFPKPIAPASATTRQTRRKKSI